MREHEVAEYSRNTRSGLYTERRQLEVVGVDIDGE